MSGFRQILYVEDEPDIRTVTKISLERVGGFTVKLCASGEEALIAVESFAPDMILLDVMMPGMDGPATLKALRAKPDLADVPVVFMTAKVQPAEVAQYKSLGACDVIAKPFDAMKLADQLKRIWDQWRGLDENRYPPEILRQMAELRAQYRARLPNEFAKLNGLASELSGTTEDRVRLEELRKCLHKLAGSGGTFGLAALSEHSRVLELKTNEFLHASSDGSIDAAALTAFVEGVALLEQTVTS